MFTALEGTSDTRTCRLLLAQRGCSYMPPGISSALGSPKPHQLPSGLLHSPPDFPDLLPFHKTYEITLWKILGFSILKNLQSSTLPKGILRRTTVSPHCMRETLFLYSAFPTPSHPTSPHPAPTWNAFSTFNSYSAFTAQALQALWTFLAKFIHMPCSHFNLST